MDRYTQLLEEQAAALSPADDDYEERLWYIASLFRSFGEALTSFLSEQGFEGDLADARAKEGFIRSRFLAAGIPSPRGIGDWFSSQKQIERETAFQLCFAFGLTREQTDAFFRKVCLKRSFDCHSIREAVYYYCMSCSLSYGKALSILERLPKDVKGPIRGGEEVLYTGTIVERIRSVDTEEELIAYVQENREQFGYNNVTASEAIRTLWQEIAGPEGLAYREGVLLAQSGAEGEDAPVTVSEAGDSVWNVYSQILGLDRAQASGFAAGRSIKSVLSENRLLPPLAEASFPDRDGINKILLGAHVSHERVRKLLILLVFYRFWARRSVEKQNLFCEAGAEDAERCLLGINKYLLDAGYPELYAGNPYDWIFLWALGDAFPLPTFRNYMGELFAVKSEQVVRRQCE